MPRKKKEPEELPELDDDDDLLGLGDEEDDEDEFADIGEGETDINIPNFLDEDEEEELAAEEAEAPAPKKKPAKKKPAAAKKAPKKTPAPAPEAPAAEALGTKALGMTGDIPVQVVAVLGKKSITMQDLLQLESGQIMDLGQPVSEVVDLVANGKLIARGELVEIDGMLGVKIVKMVK